MFTQASREQVAWLEVCPLRKSKLSIKPLEAVPIQLGAAFETGPRPQVCMATAKMIHRNISLLWCVSHKHSVSH